MRSPIFSILIISLFSVNLIFAETGHQPISMERPEEGVMIDPNDVIEAEARQDALIERLSDIEASRGEIFDKKDSDIGYQILEIEVKDGEIINVDKFKGEGATIQTDRTVDSVPFSFVGEPKDLDLEALNKAHESFEKSKNKSFLIFWNSTRPYYDKLFEKVVTYKDSWWHSSEDPVQVFSGEDGRLSEEERRSLVINAVNSLYESIEVFASQDQNNNNPASYAEVKEILDLEEELRTDILLPQKEIYEESLKNAEDEFIEAINIIVSETKGSFTIRLREDIINILVLPDNNR